MKKKICLIAQFPPPIHGLSKAVDTLYKSKEMNESYDFVRVDITDNKKFLSNYRLIKKTDADLFYFTISQSVGGNLRDLLILRLLQKQNKKCLIHLHGGYYRKLLDNDMNLFQKKKNIAALKMVSGAIVLGDSLRYIFAGLVDSNKVFVVPNCIDDEYLITSVEMEKKVQSNKKTMHILYLSNFIRSKGYDIVLNMSKEYKESDLNGSLHFDFAGNFFSAEEESYFNSFIIQNGLEDVISYHGVVSGEKKKKLLLESDFFILPTNYPKEGQPISILEAMGNGEIILTTNHAGIPDVVTNSINGCMLPYSDKLAHQYLEYIIGLKQDDIPLIQKTNYDTVLKQYLEDKYIDNLKNCFEIIINR